MRAYVVIAESEMCCIMQAKKCIYHIAEKFGGGKF